VLKFGGNEATENAGLETRHHQKYRGGNGVAAPLTPLEPPLLKSLTFAPLLLKTDKGFELQDEFRKSPFSVSISAQSTVSAQNNDHAHIILYSAEVSEIATGRRSVTHCHRGNAAASAVVVAAATWPCSQTASRQTRSRDYMTQPTPPHQTQSLRSYHCVNSSHRVVHSLVSWQGVLYTLSSLGVNTPTFVLQHPWLPFLIPPPQSWQSSSQGPKRGC